MRTWTLILGAAAVAAAGTAFTAAWADDELPTKRDGTTHAAPGTDQPVEMVARAVDLFVEEAWKAVGITPAPAADDETYVRRVYLDLVGVVPNPEQVLAFAKDKDPAKREKLVDALLESPGSARHFANLWGEVLVGQGSNDNNREYNAPMFMNWLEDRLRHQASFDSIVRDCLTADGTFWENPAVNYAARRDHSPSELAGAVSKHFLGVQIQCAQCHDHPYEEITQQDFQSFSAFWARVTLAPERIPYEKLNPQVAKRYQERFDEQVRKLVSEQGLTQAEAERRSQGIFPRSRRVGEIQGGSRLSRGEARRFEKQAGELATVKPKFLSAATYEDPAGATRRAALADWIVDPGNPYTARALANRYWGWLLGRGLVEPVDDFSSVNIPSIPGALSVLADDTAEHGFDLRRLVRVITRTRAYRLASDRGERPAKAQEFFAVGPLKPLGPQQTFDSLQVALGLVADGTALSGIDDGVPSAVEMGGGPDMMAGEEESRNRRLLRGAARSFFQTFDDDEGGESRDFGGTIPQGLFLMNSQVVNGMLTNPQVSVVPRVVSAYDNETDRIRHLFLRTLSREPTQNEIRRFVAFVKSTPRNDASETDAEGPDDGGRKRGLRRPRRLAREDRTHAAYADVLWTLLSSSEFGTNH